MTQLRADVLVLSVVMAVAAGLVGAFAVMRRMTLAADALSHVALPGIGLALLLHFQPLAGAVVMLLAGVVLIWGIERRTHLDTETITGVVFSLALAVGSMLTSGEALIDALFGEPGKLAAGETVLGVALAIAIVAFILRRRNALVLAIVSPEIARTTGISVARLNLEYLIVFALTVALGLRFLGALLMGSLIIIPAAAASRVARNLSQMLITSAVVAVVATVTGMLVAAAIGQRTGPVIVVVAATLFFLSLLRPAQE
jgi:ABC-type Mn2+/Zn2+ transport system permease subunit